MVGNDSEVNAVLIVKKHCFTSIGLIIFSIFKACFLSPASPCHHHNHPRLRCPRHCLHGSPADLGAGGADVATPQRQAAADVGHGAAAGCGAAAGDDTWMGWLGWCLVGASKKTWGDMIYKVRHVLCKDPEGCVFLLLIKRCQIYGWACRSGIW